jgi:hypothetical protein
MVKKIHLFVVGLIILVLIVSTICLGFNLGREESGSNYVGILWKWLIDLGTLFAGIGALIASYVGYMALDNWKHQSKGKVSLDRLLENQDNIAVLCCEFMTRTNGLMGNERDDFYRLTKAIDKNFSVLSRQISPNNEMLEMKELLRMPSVRIRDSGVLWEDEKAKLSQLEKKLKKYIDEM